MNSHFKQVLGLVLLAIAVAGATWALRASAAASTASTTPADKDPVASYLGVSEKEHESLTQHDPSFDADLKRLRAAVEDARAKLAEQLEKPGTTDQMIRQQVEVVINASTALQRRVMEHVLALRDRLTPAQQQKLLNLCAQGIRQGPGWAWGRGAAGGVGGGPPQENRGAGNGPGMGRGFRGGRGAATSPAN